MRRPTEAERPWSPKDVVGECRVPTIRCARHIAPQLVALAHLAYEDIVDLYRSRHGLQVYGVAYRIVGRKNGKSCIEQVRCGLFSTRELRRDREGADFGLTVGSKR